MLKDNNNKKYNSSKKIFLKNLKEQYSKKLYLKMLSIFNNK